jgi:peptide-methionine (R)-S-oxide reductase
MNRRHLLGLTAIGLTVPFLRGLRADAGTSAVAPEIARVQAQWADLIARDAAIAALEPRLTRPLADWRAALPADAYRVLFEEDTERPFSSPLNDEKRRGVFVCRACTLPLFSSAMKYDSGTGWPSFFTAIPAHLETKTDYKLIWPRTEYHCAKCGGHQGHVFDDGPPPTRERWCNNGLALAFIPATG